MAWQGGPLEPQADYDKQVSSCCRAQAERPGIS